MLKLVEEAITKNNSGIFDEFSQEYISGFLKEVITYTDNLEENLKRVKLNKEAIYQKLANSLKKTLISIYQKSLIAEIIDQQEHLEGSTPEEKYEYFVNSYLEEEYNNILERLPQLQKLLEAKQYYTLNAVKGFMKDLMDDFDEIECFLGEKIYEISEITIGDGDTHNGGKSVIELTYNESKKLFYKPHGLNNDLALEKMFMFLNGKKSLKYDLRHVRVLSYKNHGWQECIAKETCRSESEVKGYMYRFGCLMSVCYLLNCTDMHFENLIASKGYPYVIDTETLLTNLYGFEGLKVKRSSDMAQIISNSVMGTMLLPINIARIEGDKMPYDMSGLMSGMEETNVELATITNRGRSDIGYGDVLVRIDEQLSLNNSLTLNDKKVDMQSYIPDLLEGFTDCYKLFMESKDELKEIIEWKEFYEGEFRQVLRNTKLYYKFLDAASHPYFLKNEEDREKVFGKLCGTEVFSAAHQQVILSECEQLRKGDVPYFYTKYDDRALFSGNEKVCDDFYSRTLKELLTEKIDILSEHDLQRQIYFIKSSVNVKSSEEREVIYDESVDIVSYINNVHLINKKSDRYEFFGTVQTETGEKLDQMKPTLYEGVGMAMTILGLYLKTGDQKYLDEFKKMHRFEKEIIQDMYDALGNLGVFDGIGSLMYLYFNAGVALKDESYMKAFEECLDLYSKVDITEYSQMDVISGCAGIVHLLAEIWGKNISINKKKIEDVLEKFSNKLYKACCKDAIKKDTGFAHGYAGIASALVRSGYILKNDDYYNEGIALFKKEEELIAQEKEEELVAWCYGAGGLLLSRMIAKRYAKPEDQQYFVDKINHYYSNLMQYDEWLDYEDMLCHGRLGNLDILRYYGEKEGLNSDIEEINNRINMDVKKGIKTRSKLGIQKIGLMNGLTGYLYHKIREEYKKFPCILMLEAFGEVCGV